jgi:hypothetical protein
MKVILYYHTTSQQQHPIQGSDFTLQQQQELSTDALPNHIICSCNPPDVNLVANQFHVLYLC